MFLFSQLGSDEGYNSRTLYKLSLVSYTSALKLTFTFIVTFNYYSTMCGISSP